MEMPTPSARQIGADPADSFDAIRSVRSHDSCMTWASCAPTGTSAHGAHSGYLLQNSTPEFMQLS